MKRPQVAQVDEPRCIGCALCIAACPVDAIAGAPGFLHAVIADYCIGCKLCVPPCPGDCIDMVPVDQTLNDWKWPYPSTQTQEARVS